MLQQGCPITAILRGSCALCVAIGQHITVTDVDRSIAVLHAIRCIRKLAVIADFKAVVINLIRS